MPGNTVTEKFQHLKLNCHRVTDSIKSLQATKMPSNIVLVRAMKCINKGYNYCQFLTQNTIMFHSMKLSTNKTKSENSQSSMRSGGGPHGCNMRSMQLKRTRAFVSFSAMAK